MAPSIQKTVNQLFGSVGKKTIIGSLDTFILYNKFFLWGILAFSLLNLLYMIAGGDYYSVVVFLLVGFLTSFFSKNMVVILLVATVVANVIRFGARNVSEGMEGGESDDEDDDDEKENFDEYALEGSGSNPEDEPDESSDINKENFNERVIEGNTKTKKLSK